MKWFCKLVLQYEQFLQTQRSLVNERPLTFNTTMQTLSLFNAKGQARQYAEVYRPNHCLHSYISLCLYNGYLFFGLWNDKCELYNATYTHTLPHLVGKTLLMQNRVQPTHDPIYLPLHITLKYSPHTHTYRGDRTIIHSKHWQCWWTNFKIQTRLLALRLIAQKLSYTLQVLRRRKVG